MPDLRPFSSPRSTRRSHFCSRKAVAKGLGRKLIHGFPLRLGLGLKLGEQINRDIDALGSHFCLFLLSRELDLPEMLHDAADSG
jgi:hypothetical protein